MLAGATLQLCNVYCNICIHYAERGWYKWLLVYYTQQYIVFLPVDAQSQRD